jgi:signal transduction histidine kinase/DNA-binding response OmpR family regulator
MPCAGGIEDRSAEDWAIELSRAGLVAMLVVGLVDYLLGGERLAQSSPALGLLQGVNLALIGLALALTWHAIYRRRWRVIDVTLCVTLVASEAAIGIAGGDTAVFMFAATLLLAGTAVMVQWGPRWRAAASARDNRSEVELARDGAQAALRAKSDFLSQMSHEIRTPMNAILGMAELLNDGALNPEQRKYLSVMMNNGAALLDLIDDILDFARIESGHLHLESVNFDPLELAERVAETLSLRAHQKGLELTLRVAPEVPRALVGDPLRLRQVLINLVANAIKFTDRGEVAIAIERVAEGDTGGLHCTVSDTGIGIAADQREKIFARYTQASPATAREYGGSGLGLTIVKQLVELMGGRIWVESEVGRGSTFHFIVRFAMQSGGEAAGEARPELGGQRILIADRSAITRLALAETLGECGARTTQVESGAAAIDELRRADEEGAPYRIVLLDCRMLPVGGSAEPMRRVCEAAHGAGMVIPMVTSDDLKERLQRLRKLGMLHQIIKPVRQSELYSVIRALLGYDADGAGPERIERGANGAANPGLPEAGDPQAALDADPPIAEGVNITAIEPVEQIGEARKPVPSSPIGRPLRILVADDSADNRLLIQAFLKQTAGLVEHAENGEIALEKFVTGRYDVVLMDIQMPVMDGYTAAKLIRQWEQEHHATRTPIIALTASVLDEAVHKSFDAGCDTHVAKPVRRPTLLAAIHEVTAVSSQASVVAETAEQTQAGGHEFPSAAEHAGD